MKQRFLIVLSLLLSITFAWADEPNPASTTESIPALTTGKWATYSPSYNVTIPAKDNTFPVSVCIARYVGDITESYLVIQEINGSGSINIPAGSGLLLKTLSTDCLGPYIINKTSEATTDLSITPYQNSLVGTGSSSPTVAQLKAANDDASYIMVLHKKDQVFVSYGSEAGTEKVPANKAFLPVFPYGEGTNDAPSIRIVEEPAVVTALGNSAEEAKGVKILRDGQLLIIRDGITYDLMGRTIR